MKPAFEQPGPRGSLKWLAVDLDGTLAEPVWTAANPTPQIGAPIARNVTKARDAFLAGWKIVIHTSRSWTDYEAIEAWCKYHQIPQSRIVCGKLLAARYIDDRAVHESEESWIPT